MPRPREFEESAVLDAAVDCFWSRGYEATSVRDLINRTGLSGASLYNAFGDKQALFRKALDHYVERSVGQRISRCELLEPRQAIAEFFWEILKRSIADTERKGCMIVNAVFDEPPRDEAFRNAVANVLRRIEAFFLRCARDGQQAGSITASHSPEELARHLLSVLMGVRVLARVRPEEELLKGAIDTALALLDAGLKPRSAA